MQRTRLVLLSIMLSMFMFASVGNASAVVDDIPGETPTLNQWMPISLNGDYDDTNDAVYRVTTYRNDVIRAESSYGRLGFDLFGPGSLSVDSDPAMNARTIDERGYRALYYKATTQQGDESSHYVDAWAGYGSGNVNDQVRIRVQRYYKLELEDDDEGSAWFRVTDFGKPAKIHFTLFDGRNENADELLPVQLYQSVDGGAWSLRATLGRTSKWDDYVSAESPKVKTSYKMVLAEGDTAQATESAIQTLYPKARLSRTTSWSKLTRNKTYYAKGFVEPKHTTSDANKVKIRAYKKAANGKYYYKKSFSAKYTYYSSSKTRYKAAMKLTTKGQWKLVAYHAADSQNAKTYGSADYVTVK